MTDERNRELDILKGIGIFLMVFDHVGWGDIIHTYIQSFHMPLFFIVSGYLWKPGRSVISIAHKRFVKIMVPYFSYAALYLILKVTYSLITNSSIELLVLIKAILLYPTDLENMPYAPALWFLPCFYLTSVLYAFISNRMNKTKWIVIVSLAVMGFALASFSNVMLPFALMPLMITPLFMYIGELIRSYEDRLFLLLNKWWILVLLIAIDLFLVWINGSCDLRSARYHNCVLYVINAITGTLIVWGIIRKCISDSVISRILVYMSMNSIAFLCMNQLSITVIKKSITVLFADSTLMYLVIQRFVVFVVTMIMCFMLTHVIKNSKLKFVIGR